MASKVLDICLEHPELYDQDMQDNIANKIHPLIYKQLEILDTPDDSKKLNNYKEPCIILAVSGMLNGGRILKHLQFHIEDERNLILMVGYQAEGTLGRQLMEGATNITIEEKQLEVKAKIENITEFSAHADQKILKQWLSDWLDIDMRPEQYPTVFLMHGEKDSSLTYGKELETMYPNKIKTYWPYFAEVVTMWE